MYSLDMIAAAAWANEAQTAVSVTLNHPQLGEIPYTAAQSDIDLACAALFDLIAADQALETPTLSVAPYAPAYPSRAEMKADLDLAFESRVTAAAQSAPGSWKGLVFSGRLKQAEAAQAAASPEPAHYPLLSVLIGTSYGEDLAAVAASVIAEETAMHGQLAAVDGAVVAAKDAIDAAQDDAAAHAVFEAALAGLNAVGAT